MIKIHKNGRAIITKFHVHSPRSDLRNQQQFVNEDSTPTSYNFKCQFNHDKYKPLSLQIMDLYWEALCLIKNGTGQLKLQHEKKSVDVHTFM